MEIAALFKSQLSDIPAYCRERLSLRILIPMVIFLTTAAGTVSTSSDAVFTFRGTALCCLLILQFRLWDDLGDLPRDRIESPHRLLCRLSSVSHFNVLCLLLLATNIAILSRSDSHFTIVLFLLLNAGFLCWYGGLRRYFSERLGGWHVVLLKYPIFVMLMSDDASTALTLEFWLAIAVVYLCFCVFEVLDDRRLHGFVAAHVFLTLEMTGLIAIVWINSRDLMHASGIVGSDFLLRVLMTAGLLLLLIRHWSLVVLNSTERSVSAGVSGSLHYGVFLVGFGLLWR